MNLEKYEFSENQTSNTNQIIYYFESVGTKGTIKKGVYFQPKNHFEYNLALGDVDMKTEAPNFETYSNNGDLKKVIATVFGIIMDFFKNNPQKVLHFAGNEARKTKFYHWVIAKHLEEILQYFEIFGVISKTEMEEFKPENEYQGFSGILKRDFKNKN